MPSTSAAQQRLFGQIHSAQQGKDKHPSPKIKELAVKISPASVKHFAATRHDQLPDRKGKPADKKHSNPFAKRAGLLVGGAQMLEDVGKAAVPHLGQFARGAGRVLDDAGQFAGQWGRASTVGAVHPELLQDAKALGQNFTGFGQRAVPGGGSAMHAMGTDVLGKAVGGNAPLAAGLVRHGITPGRAAAGAVLGGAAIAANSDKQGADLNNRIENTMNEIESLLGVASGLLGGNSNKQGVDKYAFNLASLGEAASHLLPEDMPLALGRLKSIGGGALQGAKEHLLGGAIMGGALGGAGGAAAGASHPDAGSSRLHSALVHGGENAGIGALGGAAGGVGGGGMRGGVGGHEAFNSELAHEAGKPLSEMLAHPLSVADVMKNVPSSPLSRFTPDWRMPPDYKLPRGQADPPSPWRPRLRDEDLLGLPKQDMRAVHAVPVDRLEAGGGGTLLGGDMPQSVRNMIDRLKQGSFKSAGLGSAIGEAAGRFGSSLMSHGGDALASGARAVGKSDAFGNAVTGGQIGAALGGISGGVRGAMNPQTGQSRLQSGLSGAMRGTAVGAVGGAAAGVSASNRFNPAFKQAAIGVLTQHITKLAAANLPAIKTAAVIRKLVTAKVAGHIVKLAADKRQADQWRKVANIMGGMVASHPGGMIAPAAAHGPAAQGGGAAGIAQGTGVGMGGIIGGIKGMAGGAGGGGFSASPPRAATTAAGIANTPMGGPGSGGKWDISNGAGGGGFSASPPRAATTAAGIANTPMGGPGSGGKRDISNILSHPVFRHPGSGIDMSGHPGGQGPGTRYGPFGLPNGPGSDYMM